jgi:hypothetical protein
LDLTFPGFGVLPAGKANQPDNLVDVGHDPLDHHRRIAIFNLGEQLGQSGFGLGLFIHRVHLLLSLDDFLGQGQELFKEVEAMQQPLFMFLLEFFQALTQGDEFRVVLMFTQSGDEFDLDLLGFFVRVLGIDVKTAQTL